MIKHIITHNPNIYIYIIYIIICQIIHLPNQMITTTDQQAHQQITIKFQTKSQFSLKC